MRIALTGLILAFSLPGQTTLPGQATLPGTAPLVVQNDPAAAMVEGIHTFLDRETAQSASRRERFWQRDYASAEAYSRSVAANRERFRKIIGAVDARLPAPEMQLDATTSMPAQVAEGNGFKVFAVRWPVLKGVTAEGLLLEPDGPPLARVVAIPDADWSPEMLAGLAPGVEPAAQFARRLAENGCQVIVPALIDRRDTWSGIPSVKMTNQPHREFLYRMAFEAGRHIIGYETQKALSAVDWFARENARHKAPIAVAGYGEGGLLALYSAAIDERIAATLVSGYFQPRGNLWREPIYRDVWGLLREFGDAEIAGMIAPRTLVVEASRVPAVAGPPPQTNERKGAAPVGRLDTPPFSEVEQEVARARVFYAGLGADDKLRLVKSGDGSGAPGSEAVLAALIGLPKLKPTGSLPADRRSNFDPAPRLRRQFDDLVSFTQLLVRQSPLRRAEFWATADASSPERWKETTRFHRDYIWEEMIGRLPPPSSPANPRARLVYDEPTFRGYEVMLDVWPDVFAFGTLLVPKDLRPGERRPVVVCQHGLEGRPRDVADPKIDAPAYHRYAARLAEQGFISYAPQNPYIGEDRFRLIQRKAHPLKLALFSFILGQHQRALEWLATLPFVDSRRIGFYGLSYGGKTAVRIPPLLDGYALSICSADFNEWVWKNTSVESPYSYLLTREYDMVEFDLANIANYAELASLMAPRPFMVERGHNDIVAPDEWVAYEFAKVRRFYARLGMPERTEIEFFNGPHTIHGIGTFEFLRRHLQWPAAPQK
jgi:dienelactone hydrolase